MAESRNRKQKGIYVIAQSRELPKLPDRNDGTLFAVAVRELSAKRRRFCEAMITNGGSITEAAEAAGITRKTHYDWLASDAQYRFYIKRIHVLLSESLESVAELSTTTFWSFLREFST